MIFICAQPDEPYFLWQIEILIDNLSNLKVDKLNIHIVFSYDKDEGVSNNLMSLSKNKSHLANFFWYPDERENQIYISSIRPHILGKHFESNPWLEKEVLFYHDSDIVFTTGLPPSLREMATDDIIYVSDARAYLNASYIDSTGKTVLKSMCQALGFSEKMIRENENNSGGAQYILKGINSSFWKKVEEDSSILYEHLIKNQDKNIELFLLEYPETKIPLVVNSWCADMWALLWNLFEKSKVRIHKELNFCWANDDNRKWNENYIFHNAGISYLEENKFFYKSKFKLYSPFCSDFSLIYKDSCSRKYVDLFREEDNFYLENMFVFIFGDVKYKDTIKAYLEKYTRIEPIWLEEGETIDFELIDKLKHENILFYNTRYLVDKSKLVAMQNAKKYEAFSCVGYDLDKISPASQNLFFNDYDFQFLSKYAIIKEISFMVKYSSMMISKIGLLKILENQKIPVSESLIRLIGYRILEIGKMVNLTNNVKICYDAI